MHGPINVQSPNNISKWQMGFNSAFKWLRRMRWAEKVARMGNKRGAYGVLEGTLTERDHSRDLCINRMIILKQTVKESAGVERRGMD
jgi:hypothetical protein